MDTTVTVEYIAQLKSLLDLGLDDKGRAEHFAALFAATGGGGEGFADELVRNIAAYAVGDEALSDDAREAVAPAFPLTMAVSADPEPITVDGKKDLSHTDGTPSLALFTDVTMKPGGYFYCSATNLTFTCDTFARADSIAGGSDFQILGLTPATPAKPATPGPAGQAESGGPGECSSGRDRRARRRRRYDGSPRHQRHRRHRRRQRHRQPARHDLDQEGADRTAAGVLYPVRTGRQGWGRR